MQRSLFATDPDQLAEASANAAMKDPKHLKEFLRKADKTYLVFNALDLVDALPWPDGHEQLIQIIEAYRQERSVHPSSHDDKVMKTEQLEPEEIDAAIAQLQRVKEEILRGQ